jgi:hypothetical protein
MVHGLARQIQMMKMKMNESAARKRRFHSSCEAQRAVIRHR